MKNLIIKIFTIPFLVIYAYGNHDYLVIGNPNTGSCSGKSRPVYIKNIDPSLNLKVKYKIRESGMPESEKTTKVLNPKETIRIGCTIESDAFSRTYEILDIIYIGIGGNNDDDNKKLITSGKQFRIILDGVSCPSDDGWVGKGDVLGTIKCGEEYIGKYSDFEYKFTGLNEKTYKTETHTYDGALAEKYEINLWGIILKYNESNEIIHPEYGIIGHLSFQ